MTRSTPMPDVLAAIQAYKVRDVQARRAQCTRIEIETAAAAASPPRGFARALAGAARPGRPALIAEIKKASPSKGVIREDFDPVAIALAYAQGGATCLSVLTDQPSFSGDDAYLGAARDACALPVLRKDFLVDPWQVAESRALGADAILVIMAMVDDQLAGDLVVEAGRWGMDALVEVHDEDEMRRAVALGAELIGVNTRDLRSFEVDLAVFDRLAPLAPTHALLVAESGVFTHDDAARLASGGARAVLVGESLMRQVDITAATRALLDG